MTGRELEGRVALVTGGARNIGRAICLALAQGGATVVVNARTSLDAAQGVVAEIEKGGGKGLAHLADVADERAVEAMLAEVRSRFGRLDVLVNNAAVLYDPWARASEADLGEVHTGFETNVFGPWRTTLAFLPLLRGSRHPRVVNVSSEAGSISGMTGGGSPTYATSKAALNALTRLLAAELRSDRILVNAVCPGWTDTDMGRGGRPVAEGAASVLWGVHLPDDGPTGGFFRDGRPLPW